MLLRYSNSMIKHNVVNNRNNNGFVLFQDANIAVIATGFGRKSANPKTGNMIQVWILGRNENPVAAIKSGNDSIVCGDCKHRGIDGKKRTCYVRVANAPLAIWKAYTRGAYAYLPLERYSEVFTSRTVRFGAYGDPVLIPLAIVEAIVTVANGQTGYTHQWLNPAYAAYRAYVMASCDTAAEYDLAKSAGWRTFRIRTADAPLLSREISCPASEEMGKRTTCENCKLCSGSRVNDARKDISIIVHGAGSKNFVSLASITPAVVG